MRKRLKVAVTIFGLSLVIWLSFFITDKIRISNNEPPIFVIKVASYDDGGSEKFMGLFYSVYHVKNMELVNEEAHTVDYGFHMKSWFSSIDKVKDNLFE
ncbi:MAG: hypothetical protein ACOX56_04735 [Acholeplasmataceae bacterium]|jgi:hypothetical protein